MEKYPFILTTGARAYAFFHSEHRQIPVLRELNPDALIEINPEDAAERNIQGGDIVELYNDRGSVLGCAVVTYRVPKGVIHSYGCSAKYDPIVPGQAGATDRAGCVNLLTAGTLLAKNVPGMTPNSCLCEIRKWQA